MGKNKLVAEVAHHIFEERDFKIGKEVFLILKLRSIRAYEYESNHGTGGEGVY